MAQLFSVTYESLIVLILTSLSCSILGSLLLLRGLAMLADAISHSILLGIVLVFFLVKDLSSPLLIVGAAIFGMLTVWGVESLSQSKLVKNDEAIGLIYPLFFALAVILITVFAKNIHLDMDAVLMGEVIMVPLNRMDFLGHSVPKAVVHIGGLFLLNIIFVVVCFKELKITTFDHEYAKIAGFSSTVLFYILMTLTSLTTVVAFDAVGAILAISFLITPAASAYLICKDLKKMMLVACLYSTINSVIGYMIAIHYNVSMSGMTAFIAGITFILTVLFHKQGLITQLVRKYQNMKHYKESLFIIHLANHMNAPDEEKELGAQSIQNHLQWTNDLTLKVSRRLILKDEVYYNSSNQCYSLTHKGISRYHSIKDIYGI